MNVIDLFCGCGGFSLGFIKAGFRIKYAVDYWNGCKDTFEYNHPNTEFILSDIRELDPHDFKSKIDIIIGSPPCQEFSCQNNNPDIDKGMELVLEFLKWIKIIKPKYWIMENVPSTVKWLKWRIKDFKIPKIKIFNCADFGVPQIRLRMFAGNYIGPKMTRSKLGGIDLLGDTLKKWITIKEALRNIKNVHYPTQKPANNNFKSSQRIYGWNNIKGTCTGNSSGNGQHPDKRYFTLEEMMRFQTFPDDFQFFGSFSSIFRMIGNAVPPMMAYTLAKSLKEKNCLILFPIKKFMIYLNDFFEKNNFPLQVILK